MKSSVFAVTLAVSFLGTAQALEIEVTGHASIPIPNTIIPGDPRIPPGLLAQGVRDAERDAVITAIEKVLGPNTSREPKVTSEINSIVSQVREGQIIDTKWTRTDKTYEFTVNLALDDREFYTWLSDRGIARRLRAYSILVVMDESLAGLHSGEKTGQVYNAFVGQFQAYDLRILDNSIFRSKYFNNKPLTIEQMSDGGSLARYVACAKVEAEADFFMAGTSNITDQGKNPHTGDNRRDGYEESVGSHECKIKRPGGVVSDVGRAAEHVQQGSPRVSVREHEDREQHCQRSHDQIQLPNDPKEILHQPRLRSPNPEPLS